MIYSSNVPKRWSFQKNCTGIWSFLYHEERWHFFFPKIEYFFTGEKNTWRYDVFCMLVKVAFLFSTNIKLPFCQKSKDDLFPKNTPKDDIFGITEKDDIHPRKDDIGILDWHSRKSSNDSLYFYEDLFKCFYILFSNEKNPGDLIYRIEIWLYLYVIWLETFYNEKSSIPCTIQLLGVLFRGVTEHQLRKIFAH